MVCDYDMGGGMKVIPPFFSRKNNCNYNKICIYHVHIFYKVDIVGPQNFLHYRCMRHYASPIVLIAEASEPFTSHMLCFGLSLSLKQLCPWRSSFRGPKRWKLEGAQCGL